MYKFIFYFIYHSQVNQKDGGPFVARYIASIIVFVAIIFHILLIYSIFRYFLFAFYKSDISVDAGRSFSHKLLFWLPLVVPIFIVVYKYFNQKRIGEILKKYEGIHHFYSFLNVLKFFIIIFLPLFIGILLVNNSIQ